LPRFPAGFSPAFRNNYPRPVNTIAAAFLAFAYPEPEKGGRGKKANLKETLGFSTMRLSQARQVLRHSRELAMERKHPVWLTANRSRGYVPGAFDLLAKSKYRDAFGETRSGDLPGATPRANTAAGVCLPFGGYFGSFGVTGQLEWRKRTLNRRPAGSAPVDNRSGRPEL
jgi:hypothetical protein